ncbi:MAG: DHH family phosphoesterase [Methanomassiliicoccales archaeon]|nr:MAG: DHH family phosphoesterase [Methanomassiliicoccales archaeon]
MPSYEERVERFEKRARAVASHLRDASKVLVVGHIDADGISATAIARTALEREGIEVMTRSVKKVDEAEVSRIENEDYDTVLLVDLGSGMGTRFKDASVCIADHHAPDVHGGRTSDVGHDVRGKRRKKSANILKGQRQIDQPHLILNPMDFGIDGSREISGSGVTYWITKCLDPANKDLAALAVVGAVGDFQDSDEGRLTGLNARIVDDGVAAGVLRVEEDIRLFGRVSRPLTKFIQYSDLPLPWTSDWARCREFFKELEIPLGRKEKLRTWSDLTAEERERAINALEFELAKLGRGDCRLKGEIYILTKEAQGTELCDAKEYATLLNSCGRHGQADLGVELCTVSRNGEAFSEILNKVRGQIKTHRENLRGGIDAFDGALLVQMTALQYFRTEEEFGLPSSLETTLGTVLGMVLSSGKVPSDRPLFAFAKTEDGKLKVSARATKELVAKGLDLSSAIKLSAEKVGGVGGGHNIAAGATIEKGKEVEFLDRADMIIREQFERSGLK